MEPALAIGDFARATHMSVKTLRHYHRVGLLEPADVDAGTGYRRYALDQIPTAQVIRRFRDLDMPLSDIQAVLAAPGVEERNALIAAHLARLEGELARTQGAVASLRDLLEERGPAVAVEHQRIAATPAAAISEVVDLRDDASWFQGALGELRATLAAQGAEPAGPAGGLYADELFTEQRGRATMFVPCAAPFRPTGRVVALTIAPVELATTVHAGAQDDIDRAYGALATYVTQHALAVDGPLREEYLVDRHDTADPARWRTRIGWPIFQTRPGPE